MNIPEFFGSFEVKCCRGEDSRGPGDARVSCRGSRAGGLGSGAKGRLRNPCRRRPGHGWKPTVAPESLHSLWIPLGLAAGWLGSSGASPQRETPIELGVRSARPQPPHWCPWRLIRPCPAKTISSLPIRHGFGLPNPWHTWKLGHPPISRIGTACVSGNLPACLIDCGNSVQSGETPLSSRNNHTMLHS